jgi:signal transduction histidine kinase
LRAAQRLEIDLRILQFHNFIYLADPAPDLLAVIRADEERFGESLRRAEELAFTEAERVAVAGIQKNYQSYLLILHHDRRRAEKQQLHGQVRALADARPLRAITDLCRHNVRINEGIMQQTIEENAVLSEHLHWGLLTIGLVGPLGGILSGFGIARGLSQSLYQISVRVQDVAHKLVEDVATMKLIPESDLTNLNLQLDHVVQRVSEVMQKFHRQQHEMLRAQQLSAVGQLAASVAHEVRNPLSSIKMLVEAGLRVERPRPMTPENLRLIHREVLRLEQTVQGFLDFARPPALIRQVGDLRELLGEAVDLIRARARQQGVQVQCDIPDEPVLADVDSGQMCNVFVNLFLNALDAMPSGGTLDIRLVPPHNGQVTVEVTDAGEGIAPLMLDQLFTPFASTKSTGSGLGLNTCKRIVEEHYGTITAGNRIEGGARVTVTLPTATAAEAG